jgi:hypothetical protein
MPRKPASDIPIANEAHVPWESIDEAEESGGQGRSKSEADASEEDADSDTAPEASSEEEEESAGPRVSSQPPSTGGGWTLPLLCAGIALIACCAVIPQADANRRLAYEKQELQRDLETVQKQIEVNEAFLKQVGDDPTLAERLAQRQMKVIPQGTKVLELPHEKGGSSMSPFQLVNVPPPPALPPYKPIGGTIARLCYDNHSRLYLIGISLGMIATGLVMGSAPER